MKFSKWIVSFVIALNVAFTVAVLVAFVKTGAEPVALIGSWFAFTTTELLSLASIKRKKVDKQ